MSMSSPYMSFYNYILTWLIGLGLGQYIVHQTKPRNIFRFAFLLWIIHLGLIVYLLLFTKKFRGSKRWIYLFGKLSYQPSEGLKIALTIVLAQLIHKSRLFLALLCYGCSVICLALQPDLGNATIITAMFFIVMLISNTRKRIVLLIGLLIGSAAFIAVQSFPHAKQRFTLYKSTVDKTTRLNLAYQNLRSLGAIRNGGIFGVGPTRGTVKLYLPDAYSDFIFAVICEELGMLGGLLIGLSYFVFLLRTIHNARVYCKESIAIVGLASLIALQAWIHIGSALWIIPTKGTTLPLISHGGASTLLMHVGIGVILNFTNKIRKIRAISQ